MEEKKNKKSGSGNGEDNDILEQIKEGKKKLEKREEKINDSGLASEIEELKDEIEVLRKELSHYKKTEDDYLDKLKRIHADYDNFRKRTLREQSEIILKANKNLIEKLLPVIDSFDKALEHGKDVKSQNDEFHKGVIMIFEKLMDTLKKEGLTVIDPKGEEFNPYLCEAAVAESVQDVEEGVVLEVLRKGYKLYDFLIRPAVVKVCKKLDN
jgi:molecular chaperone GrpE